MYFGNLDVIRHSVSKATMTIEKNDSGYETKKIKSFREYGYELYVKENNKTSLIRLIMIILIIKIISIIKTFSLTVYVFD